MSSRSSLLKRAIVPLLAVAAATLTASLCAPAHAATATLTYSNYRAGTVTESVECTIQDDSTWNKAVFNAQLLVQGGGTLYQVVDTTVNHVGPGYYYDSTSAFKPTPLPQGNYNLWVICSGIDYYHNPWYASTGG